MTEPKTKGKTLLVSYNQINGFPEGKYEDDKVIVVSARSGGKLLSDGRWVSKSLESHKRRYEEAAEGLEKAIQIVETIQSINISEAVVYVGQLAVSGALRLATELHNEGKKVRVVGCDCDYEMKKQVADAIGTTYEPCECGGVNTMGRIAREYQRK